MSAASVKSIATEGAEHPIYEFPVPPAPGGDEQAVIARVGAEPITQAEFVHWDRALTPTIASYEPNSRGDCSSERASVEVKLTKEQKGKLSAAETKALCVRQHQRLVKENALEQLITYRWTIGEAAELGLSVSDAEVQKLFARAVAAGFKNKAAFHRYIVKAGRTVADELLGVRLATMEERLEGRIKRKAAQKINEATITRYYREHKAEFSTPERRDVRVIRTWTHRAIANAISEIHSGKSIADVATRVSIDKPSNEHGGLMEDVVKGEEEPGLDQAIFNAKPHVLTGPLLLRKRYYAFEVVKTSPEEHKPLKEIEDVAREKLTEALLKQEQDSSKQAFHKKWSAKTSCTPGYVISLCREFRGK